MATGWHAVEREAGGGRTIGPLTWEQLVAEARSGMLRAGDPVWNASLRDWVPAGQVPGLIPAVAAGSAPGSMGPAPAAFPGAVTTPVIAGRRPAERRRSMVPLALVMVVALVAAGLGGAWFLWLRPAGGPAASAVAQGSPGPASGAPGSPGTTAGASASGGPGSPTAAPPTREPGGLGSSALALPDPAAVKETEAYGPTALDQIIVTLEDGRGRPEAEALAARLGGSVVGGMEFINLWQISIGTRDEAGLTAALETARATAGVVVAAPNQVVKPYEDEGDGIWGVRISPLSGDPPYDGDNGAGYGMIGVQTAWDYIRGSGMDLEPVKVGVVDSGLYTGTNEFDEGTNIEFTDPSGKLSDPEKEKGKDGQLADDVSGGHGSGVNAIIGADPDDGGPAGVASVLGDKLTISNTNLWGPEYGQPWTPAQPDPDDPTVIQYPGFGTYQFSSLVAIMRQVQAGSKVINMSFGPGELEKTDPNVPAIYKAFFQRMQKEHPDVLFVAAAGNNGATPNGSQMYPGGFKLPNVMTIGNLDNDGSIWKTSNRPGGKDFEVSVYAPGNRAVRGYNKDLGTYKNTGGGTSMAAPQVAATAALLRSLNDDLTAEQIKKIIATTAEDRNGVSVLRVDEAVRMVIDLNCDLAGIPRIDKETLLGRGVVDAVALPVEGQAGVYTLRGIVKGTGIKGVDLDVTVAEGEVTAGDEPFHLDEPGEATWTVKLDPPDTGVITVRRYDNKAGSRITIEQIDVNGSYAGSLTFTQLDVDESQLTDEQREGCNLALIEALKGKALPMTLEVTVNDAGKGQAVMVIDTSSLSEEGASPPDPQTIPVSYAGNTLTFKVEESPGTTTSMRGTASKKGDAITLKGTISISGKGYSAKAVWTVVGP